MFANKVVGCCKVAFDKVHSSEKYLDMTRGYRLGIATPPKTGSFLDIIVCSYIVSLTMVPSLCYGSRTFDLVLLVFMSRWCQTRYGW